MMAMGMAGTGQKSENLLEKDEMFFLKCFLLCHHDYNWPRPKKWYHSIFSPLGGRDLRSPVRQHSHMQFSAVVLLRCRCFLHLPVYFHCSCTLPASSRPHAFDPGINQKQVIGAFRFCLHVMDKGRPNIFPGANLHFG